MSLTPEQLAIRPDILGASELASIVDEDPFVSPLKLWMKKRTPSRGPLLKERADSLASRLGSLMEAGARAFFSQETGVELVGSGETYRHPKYPHIAASPDGLPVDPRADYGYEGKIVGHDMRHHWTGSDRIPAYVEWQCRQNMAVLDKSQWHVCAIIGGTEPVLRTVIRDLEIEADLLDLADAWWTRYVLGDEEPPSLSEEDRAEYLAQKYPADHNSGVLIELDDDDERAPRAAALAEQLEAVNAWLKAAEKHKAALVNDLVEMVGDAYGITGRWGKFLHYPRGGNPEWKEIAHVLGGGTVPQSMIEQHRGEACRVPRLYGPPKPKAPRKKR